MRWRRRLFFALLIAPLLVAAVVATYLAAQQPWSLLALWLPLPVCWGLAWLLIRGGKAHMLLLAPPTPPVQHQWTERDHEAWQLVEGWIQGVEDIDPDRLTKPDYYKDTAEAMAHQIARVYHPDAADPLAPLTVREILAATELITEDLADLVDRRLPGSHVLTVKRWKQLAKAPQWIKTASNAYWIAAALVNPVQALTHYATRRFTIDPILQHLQINAVAWFATAYIQRVGLYLIELNSGRLRVGAKRWRQLVGGVRPPSPVAGQTAETESTDQVVAAAPPEEQRITLAVIGQSKAGKSSLINALLGEARAATDVNPLTDELTAYALHRPLEPDSGQDDDGGEASELALTLLDTVGYGQDSPERDKALEAAVDAAGRADLVLLTLNARDPAREVDRRFVEALRKQLAEQPHLKLPPVLAVLTHVDLLKPAAEWDPPYDWENPQNKKARSIHDAVSYTREVLGERVASVVPVCLGGGRAEGSDEALLGAILQQLDDARQVAMLRLLHEEAEKETLRRVAQQLIHTGQQAAVGVGKRLLGSARERLAKHLTRR